MKNSDVITHKIVQSEDGSRTIWKIDTATDPNMEIVFTGNYDDCVNKYRKSIRNEIKDSARKVRINSARIMDEKYYKV